MCMPARPLNLISRAQCTAISTMDMDGSNSNDNNIDSDNANDEPRIDSGATEDIVPGTQFSQVNEDDDGEPATPVPPSRRQRLFATPSSSDGDGLAERRQLAEQEVDGLAEEVLSSVRKPRGTRLAEEDDGDVSVLSMLSGQRSRPVRDGGEEAAGGGGGDDDDAVDADEDPATLIRGTDVHVKSAAAAFRDFVRGFISVEESERRMAEEARRRRKRRRAAGGAGGGDGGDDDDDDDDDDRDEGGGGGGGGGGDDDDDGNGRTPRGEDGDDDDAASRASSARPPPLYLAKLEQILLRGRSEGAADALTSAAAASGTGRAGVASLDLDAIHLYFHSPACQRLYGWLTEYPSEIVPLMDLLLGRELETLRDDLRRRQEECIAAAEAAGDAAAAEDAAGVLELLPETLPRVQVRPFHLRHLSHMRSLDPDAIDTLLSLRGMVVRTSPVIPDLKVAFFQCSICGATEQVTIDRGRIAEPTQCPSCHVRHGYALVHNRCYFSDKQMVRIQETPDEVPAGETPASIVVFAYDDLVDAVRPGDRVECTGVFRAQARRVHPKVTKVKSVYKTYVDAIHFRKVVNGVREVAAKQGTDAGKEMRRGPDDKEEDDVGKQSMSGKGTSADEVTQSARFPPERLAELVALSQQPDVYEQLTRALAPSIWEMDDVKKGVLCMLFGGNSRKVPKGTAEKRRNRQRVREEMRERGEEGWDEPDLDEEEDNTEGENLKLNKRGDINILLVGGESLCS